MKKFMRLAAAAFVLTAMGVMSVGHQAKTAKANDAFVPLFPVATENGSCACAGLGERGIGVYGK